MGKTITTAERLTDHGLNVEGLTEDQFFEVGKVLGNIERGMQWAIGDWYNGIPWGDKKSACEKVGLNWQTAEKCGHIAAKYDIRARARNLTFRHHQVLAISDLTQVQRSALLKRAAAEDWSSKTLTDERDKVLGTWEEPIKVSSSDAIVAFVEQKLPTLPSRYQKQVERTIKEASHKLADDFESEVSKAVAQRLNEQRQRLKELEAKAKSQFDNAVKMKLGAKGFMTESEFKQIRGLLHPDRHPGEESKYRKAFEIFNRLGESFS